MDALSPLPRQINLGCGQNQRPDCLNVDLRGNVSPDLVWNLDQRPYPLPRDHFEHAWASDVIEHLGSVVGFLEEVHAILAPGGILEITTPHYSCANSFTDPTHRWHLGYFSLDYFTAHLNWNFYTDVRFEIAERVLVFYPGRLGGLVSRFANRHPALYERRFAWIFPAWFLIFKLRAIKPPAATVPKA